MDERSGLAGLREQLLARGRMPDLPGGWSRQSAMLAAEGLAYGGDFIVSNLDSGTGRLQLVLVDVCGHGRAAVPAALRFSAALQSLLAVVPEEEVLVAANGFLQRQPSDEAIATAVQVGLDLATGDYSIRSAGHPPALRWSDVGREWTVDNSRGTTLGATDAPELTCSSGRLEPGDALMFYTDGVVESRTTDIDTGIDWLRGVARTALLEGWDGAADRILAHLVAGEDDRAVLIIRRS